MKRIQHWILSGFCLLSLGACTSYDTESRALFQEYTTWNAALQGLESHFERLDKVLQQQRPPLHDTAFAALTGLDSAYHAQRNRIVHEVAELRTEALQDLKVYRIEVTQLESRFRDVAAPEESQASKTALERRLSQLHTQSRNGIINFEQELDRLKQKSESKNPKGDSE